MKSETKTVIIALTATIAVVSVLMKLTVFDDMNKNNEIDTPTMTTQPSTKKLLDITPEYLFEINGFTEDDRRKEIRFNSSMGLNSSRVKSYIFDRMSNSIDYFDTVQAVYFYSENNSSDYYSAYCISHGDTPKSKELIFNLKGDLTDYFAFNGRKSADILCDGDVNNQDGINEADKSLLSKFIEQRSEPIAEKLSVNTAIDYSFLDYEEEQALDFVRLVASEKREKYSVEDEQYITFSRINLDMLKMSWEQYFPQRYAREYLYDFDSWSVNYEWEMFDRNVLYISSVSDKYTDGSFEMVVDKSTGMIITFIKYNSSGEITAWLETLEFKINERIDDSIFDKL